MTMPQVDLPLIDKIANSPDATQRLLDRGGEVAVNLVEAGLILAFTIWLSGFAAKLLQKTVARFNKGHHLDTTLSTFLSSIVRYGILIIGFIAVLQQLGVKTTSILAVLGAASLAVGLALQGALSNVAAGVMLLILRPYRIGDLVEINGKKGKVRDLDLFVTEMISLDGLRLTMPNSKVLGEMIVNYTASGRRRMEITVGIDYEDDVDKALTLLLQCATEDTRVFKTPAPWAKLTALDASTVNVTLRAWCSADDYMDTQPDLIRRIKLVFEANGLHFPYPHQVGLSRQEAMAPPLAKAAAEAAAPPVDQPSSGREDAALDEISQSVEPRRTDPPSP